MARLAFMGASFTNCHIRSFDSAACLKAVTGLARSRALVTDPKNGWITVYDETSESQDLGEIRRIARGLSSKLATDVFAFLLHGSDVFVYLLYRSGKLIDQFNSRPDYFGDVSASQRKKWSGDFKKLLRVAPRGLTIEKLRRVFSRNILFQEQLAIAFSRLIGIDPKRAGTGFRYLQEETHKHRLVHGRTHSAEAAALVSSVDKGDLNQVHELLSKGVSPNQKSRFGESILASAIRFHKREIAFALIEAGADPYSPIETNAIWSAAAHDEREILGKLLQRKSPQLHACLGTALMTAIQMGHTTIVGDLLRAGADPNTATANGLTPLMAACSRGHELMWEIVFGKEIPERQKESNWTNIVKQLLDAGANVNTQASNGMTALMMARGTGRNDLVAILEEAGADSILGPSGPEFEMLVQTLQTKKKDAAGTSNATKQAEAMKAAVSSGKGHLDPQIRELILQRMEMSRCKVND